MAKAYLGKISALVTANTSDFNSKLNASAQQIKSFSQTMQASITRAEREATASLRGIYTESQKVSRALQAAATTRLKFKGLDPSAAGSIRLAVDQFKALQQAAVLVNEPLSRAAQSVEKLSAPVQLGFEPAMRSAQKSAEYLNAALTRGGIIGERSFERIERRALAAAQAADRLAEAAQMASAGPRGTELAFAAPRVRDSLAASADVRQRAAAAPASALEGGRVANDVQKLVAIDNLIQKRRAEIESGTILNIDTTRAQASLESLLQISARVRAQVNAAIGGGGADAETASLMNRARAQREGYEERTRLERQAAEDEVALIARRTNAQREGYEERTRLERQAAEDAAALLIRRASAEQEFEDERRRRDAVAAADAAAEIAPAINRARAQRDSQIDFGLDLDAPQRQIEVLRGSIVSLKGQLDTLPAGIRTQFVPAILAAQQNLEALAAAPAATTAELARASREVDRLTQALGRARQAANIPSFRQFTRDLSTRQAVGELQALQQLLARIGAQAGGPAAQAYDRYAAALRRAIREGTTQLPATRRELERLQVAAAQAAAATDRISFRGALREIRRGGDIARGGFDNLSLAVNQAAFAIDDFFSATGGLEFKLRAVSNNITQLAFILGGTQGLFIGLAAVIGGQVAVAINKWINDGRTAEDQTKALNDALARQKSLAEELAEAFRSIGDSLTRNVFSKAARDANEFRTQLDDIIRKQRELRESRVADADPTVQRERATQAALQRRLESEENVGRRIALQRQIEESRNREREAARAANAGTATREDVRRVLEQSQASVGVAQLPPAVDAGSAAARVREANRIRARAAEDAARQSAGTEAEQRAAVEAEIRRLTPIAANGDALGFGSSAAAARAIEELNRVLALLDARGVERANNALVVSVLDGAQKVSDSLSQAQRIIEESDFGVGPGVIRGAINAVGLQLESLAKQLEQANAANDTGAIKALNEQQEALRRQSAQLLRAADAAARFAKAAEDAAGSLARSVESDLAGAENSARRDANRLEAQFGADDPRVIEARDNEGRLRRLRQNSQRQRLEIEQSIENERARFEQGLLDGFGRPEDVERARRIRRLDAQANSSVLTEEARRAARQEADRLRLEEQQAFESRPDIQRLRRRADEGDIEAQRELQRQESAERGRRYSMTPAQRAGEELDQRIADIREYFSQAVENSTGLPEDVKKIRNRMNEAIARAEEDFMRQIAPVTMGLRDSVENAVMMGPSRAALNVSDATTMEGARELNRLLRGDDSAKDVDLVALQKEANAILERIAQKKDPVAN